MPASKTTKETVDRAVVMGVLAFRSLFEGARVAHGAFFDRDAVLPMVAGVTEWLEAAGLHEALLAPEREVLELEPLTWPKDVTIAIQEAALEESVGALLFALGVLDDVPPYDTRFDPEVVLHKLPFLSDSPFVTREGMPAREELDSMRSAVSMRPVAAVEAAEQKASLYFWRARSRSLVRAGDLDARLLEGILEKGAAKSRSLGIPVDDRGEFVLFGARFAALDEERFAHCSAIAEARVRALRWVLSDADWTDVDMSS